MPIVRNHNRKIPVYHGTSRKSAKNIKNIGIYDPFVTTNIYSAEWFGKSYDEDPVILKLKVREDQLYWATRDGDIVCKAELSDIQNEDAGREFVSSEYDEDEDELYLFARGKIYPADIKQLPRGQRIRKVEKEITRWKD